MDTCEKMWLHVKECDIYELMALLVTTQQVFLQLADIDDHIHTEDIFHIPILVLFSHICKLADMFKL